MANEAVSSRQPFFPTGIFVTKTREQIEERIIRTAKRLNTRLSEESKEAWLEVLSMTEAMKIEALDSDNPFLETGLLVNEKLAGGETNLAKYREIYQNKTSKSFELFLEVKRDIKEILKQRRDGTNDEEINKLIERVDKIKMNKLDSLLTTQFGPCGGGPNAFYDPTKHEFVICPSMLMMPENTIRAVIAHEIGHSIDPCISTFPLLNVTGEKIDMPNFFSAGKPWNVTVPAQSDAKLTSFPPELIKHEYKSLITGTSVSGTPLSNNPFKTVIQCLESGHSVGAKMSDLSLAKENAERRVEILKKSGAKSDSAELQAAKDALARIDKEWTDRKACGFVSSATGGESSQIQEAFSDWISAEAVGKHISRAKSPSEKADIAFEANAFFAAVGCRNLEPDFLRDVKSKLKGTRCDTEGSQFLNDLHAMSNSNHEHPEDYKRTSAIFMVQSEAIGALGCKRNENVKSCK